MRWRCDGALLHQDEEHVLIEKPCRSIARGNKGFPAPGTAVLAYLVSTQKERQCSDEKRVR
jgi:hypothetical protein